MEAFRNHGIIGIKLKNGCRMDHTCVCVLGDFCTAAVGNLESHSAAEADIRGAENESGILHRDGQLLRTY